MINGDTLVEVDLNELKSFHSKNKSEWTITLFRSSQTKRYMGVELDVNNKILTTSKQTKNLTKYANAGVYLINTNALVNKVKIKSGIKISLEEDLLPEFKSGGGIVFGMECNGKFIDIGIPKDYVKACNIIK